MNRVRDVRRRCRVRATTFRVTPPSPVGLRVQVPRTWASPCLRPRVHRAMVPRGRNEVERPSSPASRRGGIRRRVACRVRRRCEGAGPKRILSSKEGPRRSQTPCSSQDCRASEYLLPVEEVLCVPRALCSSQDFGSLERLGTGLGDRFSDADWTLRAAWGNKKGHLLAFCEAL